MTCNRSDMWLGTSLGGGTSGDQSRYVAVRRCAPLFCKEGALTLAIHPQARTPPAVRAEIAGFHESSGVLAERHGVTAETIRRWRKPGPDC